MIDQRELLAWSKDYEYGVKYYEKFSQTTWNILTKLATSVFESFKQTGYSKQLLTIGVTECEG
jgi:hypothetical protein